MPMMDGYELSHQIRRTHTAQKIPQPYIVACSGHTEDMYVKKAWRCSIDEVIAKPAKIETLAELLRQCIEVVEE